MARDKDDDNSVSSDADRRKHKSSHKSDRRRKRSRYESDESSVDSRRNSDEERRRRRHKHSKKTSKRHKKSSKHKKKKQSSSSRRRKHSSSDSESSNADDNSSSEEEINNEGEKVVNKRLLAKLAARGETLEERQARRAAKRAAHISSTLGYTAEDNPFNDPNLHETFTWKKKQEVSGSSNNNNKDKGRRSGDDTLKEIEKVRKRRQERDEQMAEMERIRAEENRMRELENYDEWARKEEEFHLQQQKQRSAIRLVQGREKPIDILAKNLILFGLSQEESENRSSIKYSEKYNALVALQNMKAEIEEPCSLLKFLRLGELEELMTEVDAFRQLEKETQALSANKPDSRLPDNTALSFWNALSLVAREEIEILKSGGEKGQHAQLVGDIEKTFAGQSENELLQMKNEIRAKLQGNDSTVSGISQDFDREYWASVLKQIDIYMAKQELHRLHEKMLVRQLERLEQQKEDAQGQETEEKSARSSLDEPETTNSSLPEPEDAEKELGAADEVQVHSKRQAWHDKYQPRKPRFFNRVRTGFDWNKYNQTHYDQDNPPPKIVQGYKFNIFYPDLIDPTKTPRFVLEPADSDEFCIIRFIAGPPYEDIAFKIINREWNKTKKQGFKSTFERGVLSLYFNFKSHWYRR